MEKLEYVRTDRNGTKIYLDYTCRRCGGTGRSSQWSGTGYVCYACGGTGIVEKPKKVKKYTPQYAEKVAMRHAEKQKKEQQERERALRANPAPFWKEFGFNAGGKMYVVVGSACERRDELKEAGGKLMNYPFWGWRFTEPPAGFETVELDARECLHVDPIGCLCWNAEDDIFDMLDRKPRISARNGKTASKHVGVVGDKLTVRAEYVRRRGYRRPAYNGWGEEDAQIYVFKDSEGNQMVWNTAAVPDIREGETYLLTGTVKAHSEYAGQPQTELIRCKFCQA